MTFQKILAIGMVDSVHFAQWLEGASRMQATITIFPSGPNRQIHPKIKSLLAKQKSQVSMSPTVAKTSLIIWFLDKILLDRVRALVLSRFIGRLDFDVIHFHEMQSGGYPLRHIRKEKLKTIRIFYTPYGSDLYWYRRFSHHKRKIRKVLQRIDGIFPECERDLSLARELGFSGEAKPTLPAAGWRELPDHNLRPFRERNKIVVKAYGGRWGQIHQVLKSLAHLNERDKKFEVHFLSASSSTARIINKFGAKHNVEVVIHPKFSLSREQVQTLLAESRFFIAFSKSDGFPASLFEAVSHGAIPIHSNTACIPKSLSKIRPNNFLPLSQVFTVASIIRDLQDEELASSLSNDFYRWSKTHEITIGAFVKILQNAYSSN